MKILASTALITLLATNAIAADWKKDYQVIKFGVLSGENEKDRIARYTPFKEYLERELGVKIEIFTAGAYDGVIQALAADQIEFAFFQLAEDPMPMICQLVRNKFTNAVNLLDVFCTASPCQI